MRRVEPILSLAFLLVLVGGSFARSVPFEYGFIENELRNGAANHVEFEQVSDTPVVYRAWGVWNFSRPIGQIAEVALDFANYRRTFRYVYRCERIIGSNPPKLTQDTWYVEGRAAIARVWAIGAIDTLCWADSTRLRFIAHQNENRALEQKYNQREPGMLNCRTHRVRLAAFIAAAGRDSCRIGIVAQGWVQEKMPEWLVKLAAGIVLPQLMQDIETEASERAAARRPSQPVWYDRCYRWLRRFYHEYLKPQKQ